MCCARLWSYCLYKVSTCIIKVKQHHDQDPSFPRGGQRQGQDRPNIKCETSHPILNLWGGMVQGKQSKVWLTFVESYEMMISIAVVVVLDRLSRWYMIVYRQVFDVWSDLWVCGKRLKDAHVYLMLHAPIIACDWWLRIFSYTQATRVTLSIGGTLAAKYSGN